MNKNSRWFLGFTALLLFDLGTKLLALRYLQNPVIVIPKILKLAVSKNPGVAFGIPIPNIVMLVLTPILLGMVGFFITRYLQKDHRATHVSLAIIFAGGLGNFVNRFFAGGVIDFISFSFWPSFNLADAYLTVGAFLIIGFYGRMGGK